jgi:PAS domain S-box-containing protein
MRSFIMDSRAASWRFALAGLSIVALLALAGWNYLFFHGLTEMIGVGAALALFFGAWFGRDVQHGEYYRFLGGAFLFVGLLLVLHSASYPGLGVFVHGGTDTAAQLWMLSRAFLAAGLLGAPLVTDRFVSRWVPLGVWAAVFLVGVLSVFTLDSFPVMWTETGGLTPAKIIAEWIVIALLGLAAFVHSRRSEIFDRGLRRLLVSGIAVLAASEVFFILYESPTDTFNAGGHLLQVAGFYLLFESLVLSGLVRPRAELMSKLEASERRFRRLAEDAPGGIFLTDAEGRVTFVNDQIFDLVGRSRDEMGESGWLGVIAGPYRENVVTAWERLLEDRRPLEGVIGLAGDEERYVAVRATPMWDSDGAVVGYVGTALDMTSRIRLEREIEHHREELQERVRERTTELERAVADLKVANSVKDEFIANIRHELRTPLNAIIGFSAILRDGLAGPVNEEQARQLDMVNTAGHRLYELIKDILYVSRIESGEIDLAAEEVDVSTVVHGVIESLAPHASAKGLELHVDAPTTLVRTDPWALGKILGHLASNAIKFTDHGRVDVEVRVRDGDGVLVVRDTGSGIADDAVSRAFDRFTQLAPPGGGKSHGAGLGLALSKALTERMGGVMRLRAGESGGTVAEVVFPLDMSADPGS